MNFNCFSQYVLILFLFIVNPLLSQVEKTGLPSWVNKIKWGNEEVIDNNGGQQYFLVDVQDNLIKDEDYYHYVIKVLNSEGAQNISDIEVGFDPDYQRVKFHDIKIIRNNEVLDQLPSADIKIIQRERNLERKVYDGFQSAIINLSDVRENDVIEYSYTIIGSNPVLKGNYHFSYTQEYSTPVNRIYDRVVVPPNKDLIYQLLNGAEEPVVLKNIEHKEYIWDTEAIKPLIFDNNVPSWFDPQKRVILTSYKEWKDVIKWSLPLYKYKKSAFPEIEKELESISSTAKKIEHIIRFVQDKVRYLAFEDGIASYTPHDPKIVYKNRYGDCKDKSLLLVSMLSNQGIKAYPMYVNTSVGKELINKLPGQSAFNHCVVQYEFGDEVYYVDPTISLQGGGIQNNYFPDYGYGLIIREGENSLVELPISDLSKIDVKETFIVDSIGGPVELTVLTTYTGDRADNIRSYFSNTNAESISREYLNFYSSIYPNIETLSSVELYDRNREEDNKIQVEENYTIKDFWELDDAGEKLVAIVEPLLLEDLISYTSTPERTMPYVLKTPFQYTQHSAIIFPEDQDYSMYVDSVKGDGYIYSISISALNRSITVDYFYELTKNTLYPEEVSNFFKDHLAIKNIIAYYDEHRIGTDSFNTSWISILIVLVILIIGSYFAKMIYTHYDPEPFAGATGQHIGGWLVLPALGLLISPISSIYYLIDSGVFNQFIWDDIADIEVKNTLNIYIVLIWEMIMNTAFFIFSVLLIILFFKRRSSVPLLMIILYAANILLPLIDILLVNQIFPSQLSTTNSDQEVKDTISSIISGLIWIPYFKISKRVKNTFCMRYSSVIEDESQYGDKMKFD